MEKKRRKISKRWLAAAVVLGIIGLGCCIYAAGGYYRQWHEKRILEDLQQQANEASQTIEQNKAEQHQAEQAKTESEKASGVTAEPGILEQLGIELPEKSIDWDELMTLNPDIYAWIYVPGTEIDYPVLQHPTDNSHYLNYNIDGTRGYPGCIYSENYNTTDFTDPNTVLYGHNMKNGTMFGGLHLFEDSDFFEEHPYVYIYTEEDVLVYEIFAAYESGNEHILYSYDCFTNQTIFTQYLDNIMNMRTMNQNLREDIVPDGEDRILTLSTCVANQSDKRYLVQGVLINESK